MHILLSVYSCNPTKGGEPGNGWNYAYYNTLQGHTVYCLTTPEGKNEIKAQLSRQPVANLRMIYVEVPAWLQKWKDRSPQLGIYFHYIYWQYKAYKAAKELQKIRKADLVHHATYGSLQLGSFMWKLRKPMLFGPVGGGQQAPRSLKKYFMNSWKQEVIREMISTLLLKLSASKLIKHADQLLVSNYETRDLAKKMGAKQVDIFTDTLLPDDFFPDKLPERKEDAPLRLLWVGRLLPRKGLFLVLEALSRVPSSLSIHLTIVGDGPVGPHVPGWINQLHLDDRVTWLGRLPFDQVQEAYAAHDAFIFCSLRDSLGSQLIEAMAYGLPLITLDHHGAKAFIPPEAGIKVAVSEPEITLQALKEAIVYLAEHPEEKKKMGEHAFEYARQFAWSRRIEDIQQYYQKILS